MKLPSDFDIFQAFDGPPAMGEHATRWFQPGGHQKGVPVDCVKAQDILTYHVKIGRPKY